MGIDPAYGSSAFGIVVTQWEDNHIQILHASLAGALADSNDMV